VLALHDHLPEGLLTVRREQLHEILPAPTLIELPGQRDDALFVSVLLHGDEDTGFKAVQSVLRAYRGRPLPRRLALFIGNPAAARLGVRRLAEQPDFNRVWPGAEDDGTPVHAMARAVVERMRSQPLFASVDIHNNSGFNPHYACVTRLGHAFLRLAALFSRTVVYFTRPLGVQAAAFSGLCPAVTLECGKAGEQSGEEHAAAFLDACLRMPELSDRAPDAGDIDLYHTIATVQVASGVGFSFDQSAADIVFTSGIDNMNFRELAPGTAWARVGAAGLECLRVVDESGQDVRDAYFSLHDGRLVNRRKVIPTMLSQNAQNIRQDCLCYLMERLEPPAYAAGTGE
jgi:succinylglutamate desuccinylase